MQHAACLQHGAYRHAPSHRRAEGSQRAVRRGAVVAEFVGAEERLGYLIQTSMAFFKVPLAFGAVVILAALGMVLFGIVEAAERLLPPWAARAPDPF